MVTQRPDRPTVVVWGDSHAWHHLPGLRAEANAQQVNLVAFVMGACPPVVVPRDPAAECVCEEREAGARLHRAPPRQGQRGAGGHRRALAVLPQAERPAPARMEAAGARPTCSAPSRPGCSPREATGCSRPWAGSGCGRRSSGKSPGCRASGPTVPTATCPYRCDLPRSEAIAERARRSKASGRKWLRRETKALRRPWLIDVARSAVRPRRLPRRGGRRRGHLPRRTCTSTPSSATCCGGSIRPALRFE